MENHDIYIGTRGIYETPFALSSADRRQHVYAVGRTGLGKSTLLRNLLIQDIRAGAGVCLIDPHGDLADDLLDYIPRRRTADVVYLNPADVANPLAFNPLDVADPERHHLVVSGLVSIFAHLWADSWGPRLEYILANTLAAILEHGNATLLGALRMLTDEHFRAQVVRRVTDPVVRRFWIDEFERYSERFRREAIAPIQNKLGRLLGSAPLRNILCQTRSRLNIKQVMDEGKILVVNLSKGMLGEDKVNLLGSLLVGSFQLAALERAEVPEDERADFHLVIDEFHNFTTTSFASVLSEARKYRLSLTLAHQYVEQVSPVVRDAIFGNVGTMLTFGVGPSDAEVLAPYFEPLTAAHLLDLGRGEICARLTSNGAVVQPFRGVTFPPFQDANGRRQVLIEESRRHYSRPREQVEAKIRRWLA